MSSSPYPTSGASSAQPTAERISAKLMMETGAALGSMKQPTLPDGVPFAVLPQGWQLAGQPVIAKPHRPRATVRLRDAASFIAYVNDHKVARTRIYAALDPAAFTAVFDDFDTARPAKPDEGSPAVAVDVANQADWRAFRALFEVPQSREWRLWNNANRKEMGQLAFAEFLQDNLPDVVTPDGATLLEMSLNFEAASSGNYVATQRLQDGSHNLQWKADNNASGTVKLPEHMTLSIPVFENEPPRSVQARLRYRVKEGRLALWFELVRPHKVLEAAFKETYAAIAKDTSVRLLLGSPE